MLGWSRVHYLLNNLIRERFPASGRSMEWRTLGPGDRLHDEIRSLGSVIAVATDHVTTLCRGTDTRRATRSDALLGRVRDAAAAAQLPFLDLAPAFAAKPEPGAARFRFDAHWNETGHAWAAEATAQYLLRNSTLPSREGPSEAGAVRGR